MIFLVFIKKIVGILFLLITFTPCTFEKEIGQEVKQVIEYKQYPSRGTVPLFFY
jgi:hypothetical protein